MNDVYELSQISRYFISRSINKALYEQFLKRGVSLPSTKEFLIPRKIHLVCLEKRLLPLCKKRIRGWKQYHPQWEVMLWTEKELSLVPMKNEKAFFKAKNLREKKNIWGYEILEQHGGLLVDSCAECLKPFDDLHCEANFYAALADPGDIFIHNAVIGASPHHPLIHEVSSSIREGPGDDSFFRILETSGPVFFTHCLLKYLLRCEREEKMEGIVILPSTFFYPFPWNKRAYNEKDFPSREESLCYCHWEEPSPPTVSSLKRKRPSFQELGGDSRYAIYYEGNSLHDLDRKLFHTLGEEYEKKRHLIRASKKARIPRILHFIWLGKEPYPESSIAYLRSWQHYHPQWTINLWTDSETFSCPLEGIRVRNIGELDMGPTKALFDRADNFGEKADLVRYTFLLEEGGLYVDHDVECIRSFEPLIGHFDFVAGLERPLYHEGFSSLVTPCNTVIASKKGHPILKKTIESVVEIWDEVEKRYPGKERKNLWNRVMNRTFGSFAENTKKWRNQAGMRDLILPASYFFPLETFYEPYIETLKEAGFVFAIHRYKGAWINQPHET